MRPCSRPVLWGRLGLRLLTAWECVSCRRRYVWGNMRTLWSADERARSGNYRPHTPYNLRGSN
ncbi:hypothetical protein E2C01_046125 [Portunus trituberculatus]|uniref:Secreted protein n=1 Tax=Portunus trituberculatus TaxID=210409 RepID=A0A5B7G046_PORTR|nr:hypothetical protein [Portunus trituberculatus]